MFAEIIEKVPPFEEFMTVDELEHSSRRLAEDFTQVDLLTIGKSRAGRAITCLKMGKGKKNALLFAFPHPNEPIGSLTIEFLSRFFAENPDIVDELGFTWYFIKAIDPDGASLNEGWFKGKFDPIKYARHYYRPPGHEQIEWTFPVKYKKLSFTTPPPETQALMAIIDKTNPAFMYSLHNAGFCGVYWYISHANKMMYEPLVNLAANEELPIHRGEPEAPYLTKLHTAIFDLFGIQKQYDFYEENGVENPQDLIRWGTSSDDYLSRKTNGQGFTLVCEMPYFYDKALGDDSPSDHDRREIVLESLRYWKQVYAYTKTKFDPVRGYCDPASRLFTVLEDRLGNYEKRLTPRIHHAKTSKMYDGKATIAQAFDSMVAQKFYTALVPAMMARLCAETISFHPELTKDLQDAQQELDQWVEQTITDTLKGTNFEVIPIQKLVKVQVGSALIAIQHLAK